MIEPSFGVDRILSTLFEHTYYARASEDGDQKNVRGVLQLPAVVAPYRYTILPVDGRIVKDAKYPEIVKALKKEFSRLNLAGSTDDTGASIGKRYARNDELGIPFAITIDTDTLEADKCATIRERDSCAQIRVPLNEVPPLLNALFGELTFALAQEKYATQANAATDKVGKA